jgi:hypothetical protein
VLKDISHLLDSNDAFIAFESNDMVTTGVMGCCKGDKLLEELLHKYEELSFYDEDGNMNTTVTGKIVTEVFIRHGLQIGGAEQNVESWKVYPFTYFYPVKVINDKTYYTEDTCIVHWFEGTWFPEEYKRARKHDKNLIIRVLRKTPFINMYYKLRHNTQ